MWNNISTFVTIIGILQNEFSARKAEGFSANNVEDSE